MKFQLFLLKYAYIKYAGKKINKEENNHFFFIFQVVMNITDAASMKCDSDSDYFKNFTTSKNKNKKEVCKR